MTLEHKILTGIDGVLRRFFRYNNTIRRILVNQYKILGENNIADNIFNGYYFLLPEHVFDLPKIYTSQDEIVIEVYKILNVYEKNSKLFPGFSHNDEVEYYNISKAIFEAGRFSTIKPTDYNSHGSMLEIYRKEMVDL